MSTYMKLIDRAIERTVLDLSNKYPVVTITGPRQSGKTTMEKLNKKSKISN